MGVRVAVAVAVPVEVLDGVNVGVLLGVGVPVGAAQYSLKVAHRFIPTVEWIVIAIRFTYAVEGVSILKV